MFLVKVMKEGGLPSAAVEDSLDKCVDVAKVFVDADVLKDWERISVELKTKMKWSDGNTTITITGK